MKTRQSDSLFLKVDVGGETVRVFGRPEELPDVWKRVITTFRRARSKLGWDSFFAKRTETYAVAVLMGVKYWPNSQPPLE